MDENDKDLESRLEKVTPELFAEFLGQRMDQDMCCLNCGSVDIAVPQIQQITVGPDGAMAGSYLDYICVLPGKSGQANSLLSYEYRIICKNCGFTSHFAVFPVLQWIESKESDE